MKYLHNIEKSAFRHGWYIGYANGVWTIRQTNGEWRAEIYLPKWKRYFSLTASTLTQMSEKLDAEGKSEQRSRPVQVVPTRARRSGGSEARRGARAQARSDKASA